MLVTPLQAQAGNQIHSTCFLNLLAFEVLNQGTEPGPVHLRLSVKLNFPLKMRENFRVHHATNVRQTAIKPQLPAAVIIISIDIDELLSCKMQRGGN